MTRRLCGSVALALLAACTSQRAAPSSVPLAIGQIQEPSIVDPRGELAPDLATQVPSLANGGISADGLTMTYHLRNGVKWQDGAPLRASDVAFTFEQVMNPKNNVPSLTGFDQVSTRLRACVTATIRCRS